MTPDPAGMAAADPANPQSWNRYTYVMNNPLNATDPLGLQGSSQLDQCSPNSGRPIDGGIPRDPGLECGTGALDSSVAADPKTPDPPIVVPGTTITVTAEPSGVEIMRAEIAMFVSLVKNTWRHHTTTPKISNQAKNSEPCAPQNGKVSMGDSINLSTVNPFTSEGGFVAGANKQSFGATTNNYRYSGKGVGLDVGLSAQSVWALGSGSWTGPFHSLSFSGGPLAGSVFWTPGKGGWKGFSFGLGFGLPGAAYEETNYTCRAAQ